MKKQITLIGILVLILSGSADAQKGATAHITYKTDTIYFDQDWERTTINEDRIYARIIKKTSDGKPYGTARDFYYPSWKKQWEGKLQSESPEVATGMCTSWYKNGQIESKGTYINGEPQADLQVWKENGKEVVCKYQYSEILPFFHGKMHSQYNTGSSRQIIPVDIPEDVPGVIYKIDIRDEGQPPVSWGTVAVLGSALITGGVTTVPAMLATGVKALASEAANEQKPSVTTKCHYYITTSAADANYFRNTKGGMTPQNSCVQFANNTSSEVRQITIQPGTTRLYFCVNNNNDRTAATVSLTVTALQKQCEEK